MNETTLTKKKVTLYMAIPLVLRGVITLARKLIINGISENFIEYQQSKQLAVINNTSYFAFTVINLLLFLLFGYLLTKDKKKTLVFTGTAYFGFHASNLATALVNSICNVLVNFEVLSKDISSTVMDVVGLASIALQVVLATLAFTAVEGINDKYRPAENPMTLSYARKRYIIYCIIMLAVCYAVSGAPSLIPVLSDNFIESPEQGYIYSALSSVASFLSTVFSFVIIYFAGYKPSKNHNEAIRFYSASAISVPVTSIISAFISTVSSVLILTLTPVVAAGADLSTVPTEHFTISATINQVAYIVSIITLPIEILIKLLALKLFFSNKAVQVEAEVTAESEATAEAEVEISEAEEATEE